MNLVTWEATKIVHDNNNNNNKKKNHHPATVSISTTNPSQIMTSTMSPECISRWEWPSLDQWKEQPQRIRSSSPSSRVDHQHVHQLVAPRSQAHPTAMGMMQIQIIVITAAENHPPKQRQSAVRQIHVLVQSADATSTNPWHRLAAQYMAWTSLQVAMRQSFVIANISNNNNHTVWNVTYVLPAQACNDSDDNRPHVQGWEALGHVKCDGRDTSATTTTTSSSTSPDVTVQTLLPGLLWDLAWDTDFDCVGPSRLLETFVNLYRRQNIEGRTSSNG
eukprot:scaffold1803_cov92-Amphora_coffeaeformis.AAC.5